MIALLPKAKMCLLLTFLIPIFSFSQTTSQTLSENLSNDPRIESFKIDQARETPTFIRMNTQKSDLSPSDVPQFLSEIFGTSAETSFQQQEILDNKGCEEILIRAVHAARERSAKLAKLLGDQ